MGDTVDRPSGVKGYDIAKDWRNEKGGEIGFFPVVARNENG